MPDPMPNCVVAVQFDAGATPPFSFACSSATRGWQVYSNGGIYPPIIGRRIQFRVRDNAEFQIAGFQIAAEELGPLPPSERWPPLPILESGIPGVTCISPSTYPPANDQATFSELTFAMEVHRWFYRLAVLVDGDLVWDDPKIHDDGSE